MLIEFKVANYRSFREEQTLSFVASNMDKGILPENIIDLQLPGMSGLSYLKSIALFGPNASGKSNLLTALSDFCHFAAHSATLGYPIHAEPFGLDHESKTQPTFFEVTFVNEDVRYLYGLSATVERIVEEYLVAYPKGLPRQWYHRRWNATTQEYKWDFKASFKKGRESLERLAKPKATFLSTGARLEHELLKSVQHWFASNGSVTRVGEEALVNLTAQLLYHSVIDKESVLELLHKAGLGITDVGVLQSILVESSVPKYKSLLATLAGHEPERTYLPFFTHSGECPVVSHLGDYPGTSLQRMEESRGTLNYFSLLGPILKLLKYPGLEMIDGIDSGLHPLLSETLIRFFHQQSKMSQIIFTSHDPFLLGNDILRRDQIWFTEKDKNGASKLFPLTDFSPRKDEARIKAYMSGRYGAVPFLEEVPQ